MDWSDLLSVAGALAAILSVNLLMFNLLLKSAIRALEQNDESIKELLDAKLEPIKEAIPEIKKALSNHVTKTDDKIDKLSADVVELKTMILQLLKDKDKK